MWHSWKTIFRFDESEKIQKGNQNTYLGKIDLVKKEVSKVIKMNTKCKLSACYFLIYFLNM
jgi:hypothetical protein